MIHITEKAAPDAGLSARLSELTKMRSVLSEMPKVAQKDILTGAAFEALHKSLVSATEEKHRISENLIKMKVEREKIAKWGDFNPQDLEKLSEKGLYFSFYLISQKEIENIPEDCRYIVLKSIDKQCAIAAVDELPSSFNSSRFAIPKLGVSQMDADMARKKARLEAIEAQLAESASRISSYDKAIRTLTDEIVYKSVDNGAIAEEGLSLLCGFIPEADLAQFKDAARKNCWAYALDDPSEEDPVPTKVRYNKVTRIMKPVFDMLGTVPGYREYDISMFFLLFLSLFFGMIIGDAAYGAVFLLVAVILNIKSKKCSNLNLLLYVMSIATIVWGAMTGTWFGIDADILMEKVPFLEKLVIKPIANYPGHYGIDENAAQNTVMKFCFAIGTIQLSLACLMNVIRKWKEKSLAFVADIAWLAMIISIYFLSLMLVIGVEIDNEKLVFGIIIGGLLLVIVFGAQAPGQSFGKGLKAGLGGAFTTFLNTISAFGNVMSYIRLFAVGMASLAISQSFNGMASDMALPLGVLVLIIGHALNIVMGLLSVVVHGVRLNLLEFSGQLGMEWAGIPYEPFRKND